MIEAVYLGVRGYGTVAANRENMDSFRYRFLIGGKERLFTVENGPKDADGNYSYPIQNLLKRGYTYIIDVTDGKVTSASEVLPASADPNGSYTPPVTGEPGVKTVKNFILTALGPVGTTLYIYGGGWNWQDDGASAQVMTVGVSPDWVRFFDSQDAGFTYRDRDGDKSNRDRENSYYPYNGYNEYYYAGLDCSGFVSWALNNTFNKEAVNDVFFSASTNTAESLALRGFGSRTRGSAAELKAGDIVSVNGHVWISLGTCRDGSVIIIHSTPSDSRAGQPGGGAQISAIGDSTDCEAYKLADEYTSGYYQKWYSRYPVKLCDPSVYLSFDDGLTGIFSWDISGENGGLSDPDGWRSLTPAQILADIFG